MKTLLLLERMGNNMVARHQFQERDSDIFTLLVDLAESGSEFVIESSDDETVTAYGLSAEDSDLNIHHPVVLKKEAEAFKLNLKNPGVHYFQLDMSEVAKPALLVMEEEQDTSGQATGLDHFLKSRLPVVFEIGKTDMLIHDVLSLSLGSVIELHRLVGQALDIYVGEELVAQGEVVVMPDHTFGARVLKVLPIAEQMNQKFAMETGGIQ